MRPLLNLSVCAQMNIKTIKIFTKRISLPHTYIELLMPLSVSIDQLDKVQVVDTVGGVCVAIGGVAVAMD